MKVQLVNQMSNRKILAQLMALTLAFIFISQVSCVKKRDATFPEGAGQDLLSVSEYDSREDVLETNEAKGTVLSASGESLSERESSRVKIVGYSTEAPLFPKDLELAGLTKTRYKLIYKISGQKLIIYRNSDEKSVTSEEKLLAETEDDRTYSVPLLSYPITGFFKVVLAKDDNGDETARLKEETVLSKNEATHFRISKVPEIAGFQELSEQIIKAGFFDGNWYTLTSTAKSTEEASNLLTRQNPLSYDWSSAERIQFVQTHDLILGLVDGADKGAKPTDDRSKINNMKTLVKIPVKYFDPQTATVDSSGTKTETTKVKTKDRKWAIVSFKDAKSEAINQLAKQENSSPILTVFRMNDDFFMYSLQFKGSRLTSAFIRESAIKKNSDLKH